MLKRSYKPKVATDNVWHKLKVFQFFGILACELDDNGTIKPMHWFKFLPIALTWSALNGLLYFSGYVHIAKRNPDQSIIDVANAQMNLYHKSTTDSTAMHASILMNIAMAVLLWIANFMLSRKWPDYWHSLNSSFNSNGNMETKMDTKVSRYVSL